MARKLRIACTIFVTLVHRKIVPNIAFKTVAKKLAIASARRTGHGLTVTNAKRPIFVDKN